ncbi:MucBP domain-containing protein [Levilactobacillus yiduensis]|uniref:MucBP domain-containing protein n=1 Tax=Levilactobacillus yiduensis TaxID=2953880 RepID=UPI000EF2A083|nr:MucBP domain-containing protein [Levilactobacillus yiduensis]AYM02118.1 LPXTG cell wall anchor domain-containing protein [Levilactobacillus brevis]
MFKGHNESLHYKMYKSGKSWIFAGLTAGLLLTFGGTTALADTTPTTDDPVAEQSTIQPDETTKTTVALKDTQPAETTPTSAETPSAEKATDDPVPDSEPNSNVDVDDPAITPKESEEVNDPELVDTADKSSSSDETSEKTDTDIPTQPAKTLNVHNRYGLMRSAPTVATAPVVEAAPAVTVNESIDDWMPNKALQDLVASQLKKTVAALTKADLLKLTSLEIGWGQTSTFIDGTSSYSLEGLQYATNLTHLDLGYNLMNRQFHKYLNGDITDISQLAALTKLTYLDLSSNRISNISALTDLKSLKQLMISGNAIADFSALDYKQYSDMEFGTQDIVLTDLVTIDPSNPTITIPQIFKLPQNYSANLQYDVATDYTKTIKDLYVWQDPMTGAGATHRFLRGGTIKTNEQGAHVANPDGSVTFINIPKQISPADVPSDRVDISIIQNPVTYYLMEDIVGGYEVQANVFIPYDNPKTAGDLTVKYLDTDSKSIQADQVVTGKLTSDTYDLTAETINLKGYTFDHADGELTGPYTTDPQTISLYFTKDATKPVTPVTPPVVTPTTTVTVTTHYVDQNGQSLHADHLQTGQAGDHYTTTAIDIPGFSLTTTPANASGTLGAADVVVTYVYNKLDEAGNNPKPTKPTTTTDSGGSAATAEDLVNQATPPDKPQAGDVANLVSTGGQGATVADLSTSAGDPNPAKATVTATASPATITPAAKTTLPQTNEQTRSPLIGLALLLGALVGFGLKRRKQR